MYRTVFLNKKNLSKRIGLFSASHSNSAYRKSEVRPFDQSLYVGLIKTLSLFTCDNYNIIMDCSCNVLSHR